ncbi:methyltransferase domain-containing protein [Streptomyces iconiensis]|uniref:Protein-L-isoaspartate O-methyltransferase n=1 Tax=Streptomyces iconiensis TaxID=1384038 RepID=A0ABT6ZQ95_9ACTN|nr:methyltransferase domain-containing protein [Streptomyces iconiensis]MDJ1131228.1 methyltransferase domain-containing protein [Streptomyces iconiensis]
MTITAEPSAEDLRRRLTDHLVAEGVLHNPAWKHAFVTAPREEFVPAFSLRTADGVRAYQTGEPEYLETVYRDVSLITQRDASGTATSSSSQPRVMAAMLEALPDADGTRVLEIGTGAGYNAALLCERYGDEQVVSLDIDPGLTAAARQRLHSAGYTPTLITGDGTGAHTPLAPYGALIATCGLPRIPAAWLDQLAPGGTIVANLGYGLAVLRLDEHGAAQGHFLPEMASFMTARTTSESVPSEQHDVTTLMRAVGTVTSAHVPWDVTGPMPRFLGAMLHPSATDLTLTDENGTTVHAITDAASGARARLSHRGEDARIDQGGPRALWDERLALLRDWSRAGQPGVERYGLTVQGCTHTLWLDTPDGLSWTLP